MLEKVMKHFEDGKIINSVKMSTTRFAITYYIFHDLDLDGKFFTINRNEAIEVIEMMVPSSIQGGKPKSETHIKEIVKSRKIQTDHIQEVELITKEDEDYNWIKQVVMTYISKVNAMEKETNDEKEAKKE